MLVMQDIQLGILIALLPAFGDSKDTSDGAIILTTLIILLKTVASFIVVMGKIYCSIKLTKRRLLRSIPVYCRPLCAAY